MVIPSASNRVEKSIYIYIYIVVALTLFSFLTSIGFSINGLGSNNVFAADQSSNVNYSVAVEPSLSISVSSSDVTLNINPAVSQFASQDLTVKVGTNNRRGYKLYINTDNNITDLVKTDDNNAYIENITTETDTDHFPTNYWGYKVNSNVLNHTNYNPLVTGTLISQSRTATNEDTSTLTFAAKANMNKPAGSYKLDLEFNAIASPDYITIAEAEYLQEVSDKASGGCPADLSSTTTYTLKDSRDNQEYEVARLADGNCWMITNLNLGAVSFTTALTSANTNMSTNSTIEASDFLNWNRTVSGYDLSNTTPKFSPVSGTDSTSDTPYGTVYNYCATTAKTYCYAAGTAAGDVKYDICPRGWRLPTGRNSSIAELDNLYGLTAYNSFAKMRASVKNGGAAFALPGIFYTSASAIAFPGQRGYYLTSNPVDGNDVSVYSLALVNNNIYTSATSTSRDGGYSIRCILN